MSTDQLNHKVPDWYIHLKLMSMTMQNPVKQPTTIEKFVDSTFYPTKFVGIYPRNDSKGSHPLWKAISSLLLTAICGNTVLCLYYFNEVYPSFYSKNALRLCIDRFHFFIGCFSAGFCVLCSLLFADDLTAVFNHVGRVDVVMMSLGLEVKSSYARSVFKLVLRMVVVGVLAYIYAVHILFAQGNTGCNAAKLSNIVGVTVTYCIVVAMEYQHNVLMTSVGMRFRMIRDRIVENGPESLPPSFKEIAELEALVKAYDQLNESCIIINEMFGKQILFVIGTIFSTVTSSANYIVQDVISLITERSNIESPGLLLLNCYWGFFRLLELWLIIAACDSVVEKKKLYLHISSQKEPVFTAYGFFTLDNSLFHSVIAAATTYIVILIQFSQSGPSNSGSATVQTNFTVSTSLPESHLLPMTPQSA